MSSLSDEKKLYQRLKILSDAFLLSARPLDYKSVLRIVTKHFKVFTDADASVLMLNNKDGNLTPVCSIGIPFSKIKDVSLPSSTRLKDILTHPVLDVRYTSFMNTPLIQNRKLIGLSAVFSIVPEKFHAFEYNKYEELLLTMLASYITTSIENAILTSTIKTIEHFKSDWENIFDTIDDLISIHDVDFNIVRANKTVARKFNMDITDIVGKKCYKIFHGMDEPSNVCPCCKSAETKAEYSVDIEDPHMNGIFNITTFPLFDETGKFTGTICVAKDVTEHKKMRNQIIQAEKILTLGMRAAWFVHEIDNPLSVVTGYTQSLLKTATEKNRHELTMIQKNVERAMAIGKHILSFIRHEGTTKGHIDIHKVIEEAISWCTYKLEAQNVQLVREYDKLPLIVNCDTDQMQQVFINIINNAWDAMESQKNVGRILSIKTGKRSSLVTVDLKDTGSGISAEIIKRIFEPFFTTKEVEKGIGLGLSICQKVIQDHGGNIQVDSRLGEGTTFTVELPLVETVDMKRTI